ncbi:cytochrome P450 [Umezawaea endophytica]|uniref:Cytochrome P450 n=1 Tax=Umezawaea endophytica TaxID=1654476 RepID=A0A9X2VIS7_9PSEU|nr:cytochrome P450 [Umezawaea endophytica]MCS7476889.1 cytochrome P450 [Umezawaea endophytica]
MTETCPYQAKAEPTPTPELPLPMRRNGFDPTPELLALRDQERISRTTTPFGETAWLITRYEDVKTALSEPTLFSNAGPVPGFDQASDAQRAVATGNLLTYDPPDHTRLRRMLTGQFTVRRMRDLTPRVEQIVESHLQAMERRGAPTDLVADFALPVPSLVICELLGVPWDERDEFLHRSNKQMDLRLPEQERLTLLAELHGYLAGLVARARRDPGDDLLGLLIREHSTDLTTEELTGIALLLLVAGHETTANMLALGTLALLRHPDQLALVRDDPAAVNPAVEELMRWLSVVHTGVQRTAATDFEFAGVRMRAGDAVVLAFPSANRDHALVDDPDRLDITRGAPGHLGFGHGVHHCLGAPLARLEMRVAFPALLRRFPTLALAKPDDEIAFRSYNAVYGLESLPVTW